MIDDRLLSMIKRDALLVNTARGGIIDQKTLTARLANGEFRAALDVLEQEPIDPNDPLLKLDNVLITPHQAGVTTNLRATLTADLLRESAVRNATSGIITFSRFLRSFSPWKFT